MGPKGTLLVVDDEPLIREVLERSLIRHGYEVKTASDVPQAQALLSRHDFDLVLTDLQMPDQSGMDLIDDIRRRSMQLPVVMLTGYGTMEAVVQAMRKGANDFLTKPPRPKELMSVIDREVARYQQTQPPGTAENVSVRLDVAQMDRIEQALVTLRAEINARCVVVIEGNGSVIAAKGAVADLNVAALGALVAGNFAATSGIASLIGESSAFRLNFHEGEQYSVYSGEVVAGVFLMVVFGQDVRLGAVRYYTGRALAELNSVMAGAVAVASAGPPVETVVPQPYREPSPAGTPATGAAAPTGAPEYDETVEAGKVYSFEELLNSGVLDDDVLASLETQLDNLWKPA